VLVNDGHVAHGFDRRSVRHQMRSTQVIAWHVACRLQCCAAIRVHCDGLLLLFAVHFEQTFHFVGVQEREHFGVHAFESVRRGQFDFRIASIGSRALVQMCRAVTVCQRVGTRCARRHRRRCARNVGKLVFVELFGDLFEMFDEQRVGAGRGGLHIELMLELVA